MTEHLAIAVVASWLAVGLGLRAFRVVRALRPFRPSPSPPPPPPSPRPAPSGRTPAAPALPAPALSDEVLFERLWLIVRREQVPVLIRGHRVEWKAPDGGTRVTAGSYVHPSGVIWLHPDFRRSWWVLAHELGHRALHLAGRHSHSEEEANAAGRALLRSVITEEEAAELSDALDIWLPGPAAAERGVA